MVHADHGIGQVIGLRALAVRGAATGCLGRSRRRRRGRPRRRGRRRRRGDGDRLPRGQDAAAAAVAPRSDPALQRHRGHRAAPRPARRLELAQDQEPRARERARHGEGAAQALRRAPARAGAGAVPRLRPPAAVRGVVRVRRDRRPARRDRGDQAGPREHAADGPPALRRRRLRQDRGRHARRVQGGRLGLSGGGARAHHHPRRPAPRDLPPAHAGVPGAASTWCRASAPPRRCARSPRRSRSTRSTSWSAPTACCRRTSSSRGSAS